MLDNGIRQHRHKHRLREREKKGCFKEIPLDGVVLDVPKTRPLQGGPHDAQWALFMIATCGLQMSHESIIAVEGEGDSEEYEVNNGLRQGSVLSPLLFIAVLDLISRNTVVNDAMKKRLYADDLALMTNGKQQLQTTMEEWNGLFIKHGLKLNLEKTEVLHIGHQGEELDIELEGKVLNQRDSFVYLGGAVYGDGKTEREVHRRVQAGANAWRAVEVVMADRRISKRLKGKVMSTDIRNTWKTINEILSRNHKTIYFPKSLNINGNEITNQLHIAT